MKHLKTFESFSINEEEGSIRKFFTGHDSKEAKETAQAEFTKALDEAEALVKKSPEDYVFNREALEKQAAENKFLGGLRIQRGGRDPRVFIVYDKGVTGFETIAAASANRTQNPLG